MSSDEATGYDALLELIERELQYAAERRLDEMAAVRAARASLIATLPATPPVSARATLERAQLMHKRLEIELLHRRDELLFDLRRLEQAKRTANGYAAAVPSRRARISADA